METGKTGAEQVMWDLSQLYSGVNDPQIDNDVAEFTKKAKAFYGNYRGDMAEKLRSAICDYAEISELGDKIGVHLYLAQSIDTGNALVKAKIAEVDQVVTEAQGEYLTFFELELVAIADDVLAKLYANDSVVAKHRPWIEHARVFKPHLLSEPVESALTKRSPFGTGAWSEFFDEFESDLEFEFGGKKQTLPEMLHVLTDSKDAEERASVLAVINNGFKGIFAKYSAQTLWMTVGSSAVERKERGYKHPMEVRNKYNRIADDVVDALHAAVVETAGPLAQRYYRLKAAHLGFAKLRWSDRNAPLPFTDNTVVPYSEALNIVRAAYADFSPTLAAIVGDFVESKRIHAAPGKGKRGGAYNYSFTLPGSKPISFVFMSYLGSNRDVMTLAHELGHGVHGMLAGESQGTLMMHAPMAFAETASVFGEMTTFNFLKDRARTAGDVRGQVALLMGKMDDVLNTMVRQIGFSNFERRIHGWNPSSGAWEEPKKFSPEELNNIWLTTAKQLYGEDGEVFTYENAEYLWAYISHFHRPFYVYSYAFGELLTQSLYAERSRLGDAFEPLYLDLLRSGSTRNAVELLAPFGLDPSKKEFWVRGIEISLGAMLAEAEELSRSIGVSV